MDVISLPFGSDIFGASSSLTLKPRLQGCPAQALGLKQGQFALEVGFDVR
jgi:hypothetical protein